MSSTNTANVIERVLNSKTIFNYLFVTKFPITNVSNGCFGFECDILERNVERNWYKWFRNKLTLQKHGPLFQVSHLWDISQAPVVQTLDSAIHRINHYPADKYYGNQLRYPLDSDLSGG